MKAKAEVSEKKDFTRSSAVSFKSFLDFIIYSNIAVAFCTASAAAGAFYFSNSPVNLTCLLFIFSATSFVYNLDRLKPGKSDAVNSPERTEWISQNTFFIKSSLYFHFSACLICLGLNGQINTLLLSGILLCFCFLYRGALKRLPFMKNFTVASVWAASVSALPCLWQNTEVNLVFLAFCFLVALINTIIFDLRDLKGDLLEEIKSIPILSSPKTCTTILYSLCLITIIFSYSYVSSILAFIPAAYVLIYNLEDSQIKYLTADLVLALPLLLTALN